MAGYQSLRLKRKDLEEVLDDFSDFYLSSPARKIRRLDAELPPIMEEEEPGIPVGFGQPLQAEQELSAPLVEELPSVPVNEERALVLYKPVKSSSLQSSSSSDYIITLNSDLIPGLRDPAFWSGHTKFPKPEDRAESAEEERARASNNLAVVPWTGHQFPSASVVDLSPSEIAEPMEAEELEDGSMDIEVDDRLQASGLGEGEGLQKWQQPHCMTPQLPQNTSAPIMWSW